MFAGKQQQTCSDEELIGLYKKTNEAWYVGEVFQRYTTLIGSLAYKYLKNNAETEDAVMDVFEILQEDLKTHEIHNFKAWLYSVTKNHCLKKKRLNTKERNSRDALVTSASSVPGVHADMERELTLLKNKRLDQLETAINTLSDEQKRCVELFFLKEKRYAEVAEITGYSLKQVKSYLQNGKRNLKGLLIEEQ